jgi:hypothetical protein
MEEDDDDDVYLKHIIEETVRQVGHLPELTAFVQKVSQKQP